MTYFPHVLLVVCLLYSPVALSLFMQSWNFVVPYDLISLRRHEFLSSVHGEFCLYFILYSDCIVCFCVLELKTCYFKMFCDIETIIISAIRTFLRTPLILVYEYV